MQITKTKNQWWAINLASLLGLALLSGYSIVPKQLLPLRWALSLTPVGLIQGLLETDEKNARIFSYIIHAPANRAGYGDVQFLWIVGIILAASSTILLWLTFPDHKLRRKQ